MIATKAARHQRGNELLVAVRRALKEGVARGSGTTLTRPHHTMTPTTPLSWFLVS